jgi:hypothetical protein
MTCDNGIALIEENYWAYKLNQSTITNQSTTTTTTKIEIFHVLETVPCPKGRCVGGSYEKGMIINPCTTNRRQTSDNVMCGACIKDHIEFGSSCIG